ncbi:MAG: nitrous oxide reductase accessory protein NosL [Planctomycetes bacterium]|nr:nitrous oxide reductase accessory protein NosL [Planctomycetota bacterium]
MSFARCCCSLLALLATACGNADDAQRLRPAARGIDAAGHMHPGPHDRCPLCAMPTADSLEVAAIELTDGATHYFCCTSCMLRAWLGPKAHLAAGERKVVRARAIDYFTGEHVDAAEVWWVAGADVTGAMGRMVVPLLGDAALTKFRERHGAPLVFRLRDLDAGLLQRATSSAPAGDEQR